MKSKKPRGPKTLLTKVQELDSAFADEVVGFPIPQLEKRISDLQKELESSEQHKADNEPLRNAKSEVKELSGGYNDVKKAVKLKTKLLVSLIHEKGGQ